jgi:hypothetical protein
MEELTTETQRHRETNAKTTKTQRSGEQEGFFPPFHLMFSSVPLWLCGELFLGLSSCPSQIALRNVHALNKGLNCISLIATQDEAVQGFRAGVGAGRSSIRGKHSHLRRAEKAHRGQLGGVFASRPERRAILGHSEFGPCHRPAIPSHSSIRNCTRPIKSETRAMTV